MHPSSPAGCGGGVAELCQAVIDLRMNIDPAEYAQRRSWGWLLLGGVKEVVLFSMKPVLA